MGEERRKIQDLMARRGYITDTKIQHPLFYHWENMLRNKKLENLIINCMQFSPFYTLIFLSNFTRTKNNFTLH